MSLAEFVREHRDDDTTKLLLSAARYKDIDIPLAVQQIEGLRTAAVKWPSLAACDEYLYPPRLNREQSSSEATARYKAELLSTLQPSMPNLADLTGGMGIDAFAFAKVAEHVDYVECDPQLCALMEHNLRVLGIGNVTVHCTDSLQWLSTLNAPLSTLYIDPARRAESGRKVTAFEDCTPDILSTLPLLCDSAGCLMVKASPMIDISLGASQLNDVTEVHIVAVRGECKEVLFMRTPNTAADPRIVCVNLRATGTDTFAFTREEERAASLMPPVPTTERPRYLYDPHAALKKGGCHSLLARHYNVAPVSHGVHLYASDKLLPDFPGRVFEVVDEVKPTAKEVRRKLPDGRASVICRGYPLQAEELRRRLKLEESNDSLIVATTIGSRHRVFVAKSIKSSIQ